MTEPIYERVLSDLERDAHRAGVWATRHLPHHAGRHATSTQPPPSATMTLTGHNPTPEEAMSLATIESAIRGKISDAENAVHKAAADVAPHLAELADIASEISESTLFQTVLGATLGPDDEQVIVSLVKRLDQSAHDAETAVDGTAATAAVGVPVAGEPVSDEPAAAPVVVAASAEQSAPSPVGS